MLIISLKTHKAGLYFLHIGSPMPITEADDYIFQADGDELEICCKALSSIPNKRVINFEGEELNTIIAYWNKLYPSKHSIAEQKLTPEQEFKIPQAAVVAAMPIYEEEMDKQNLIVCRNLTNYYAQENVNLIGISNDLIISVGALPKSDYEALKRILSIAAPHIIKEYLRLVNIIKPSEKQIYDNEDDKDKVYKTGFNNGLRALSLEIANHYTSLEAS